MWIRSLFNLFRNLFQPTEVKFEVKVRLAYSVAPCNRRGRVGATKLLFSESERLTILGSQVDYLLVDPNKLVAHGECFSRMRKLASFVWREYFDDPMKNIDISIIDKLLWVGACRRCACLFEAL